MNRSIYILFVIVLLSSTSLAANAAPNFVVVYVDDLGWAETSVEMIKGRPDTRSDYYQTPNFVRLARDGMVLSSCYSPSARETLPMTARRISPMTIQSAYSL